jgi:2,3-bisphosphoglycerate-independent phosphoglycerate mutase
MIAQKPITEKVMLIVLDGVGVAPDSRGNAISQANIPNLRKYWDAYPHTYIQASGPAVGLPDGVYGNSEVGHLNLGAGKTVLQNLPRINKAITNGSFYNNQTIGQAYDHVVNNGSRVHIVGCLSDGSVHSHIDHFIATLEFFAKKNYEGKVYFHAFTDGRDTAPTVAAKHLKKLEAAIQKNNLGHIASIIGRAYAMDRGKKYERTQMAYDLMTSGKGQSFATWQEGIKQAYANDETDEYIMPIILPDNDVLPVVQSNDAILFMNFRSDRALQMTDAFINPEFTGFPVKSLENLFYASMVAYRRNFPVNQFFPKEYLKLTLGRVLAENQKRQLRIAETEKFPHVTYFFNGGLPIKYKGEDRTEIASPNVATYDMKPEMSIFELTESLMEKIQLNIYDFICVNLANPDMVGHTGNLSACVKAMEYTDQALGKIVPEFIARGGIVLLTADHGNVEELIKLDTGEIDTEHSFNPVPFIAVGNNIQDMAFKYGTLGNVAPTILELLGLQKPTEMQEESLIRYHST